MHDPTTTLPDSHNPPPLVLFTTCRPPHITHCAHDPTYPNPPTHPPTLQHLVKLLHDTSSGTAVLRFLTFRLQGW